LVENVNVIINCAGHKEFDTPLEVATKINVTGPLLLMQLAEECHNFEAFCQVSTLFSLSDRLGFLDEKMYESNVNWQQEYNKINSMDQFELRHNQARITQGFPNNHCFSKRMGDELLV